MTALNLFLRYRYTPSPLTLYTGIHKLAPGTMAVFEAGRWRIERWHRYRPEPFGHTKSDDEATEELLAIYKRALKASSDQRRARWLAAQRRRRLRAAAGSDDLYGSDWQTYTVGYGTATHIRDDELSRCGGNCASVFGAQQRAVQLTSGSVREGATPASCRCSRSRSRPHQSYRCTSSVERARQDVKVALVGQGPDELFGGYKRHLGVRYGDYWRSVPPLVSRGVSRRESSGCPATKHSSEACIHSMSRIGCCATRTCSRSARAL